MKCGGLKLEETDRNRNVEVGVTLLEISAAGTLVHYFCLLLHFRKHPHGLKPFELTYTVLQSESILKIQVLKCILEDFISEAESSIVVKPKLIVPSLQVWI